MTIPSSIAIMAMIECPPLCKKPPPRIALIKSMREAVKLFCFPKVALGAKLIQPLVRLISAWYYLPCLQSLGHGATGLFKVGAVIESAIAYIFFEISEIVLELLLINRLHHLDIKRGKARCVGNISLIAYVIQLNMPGRVLASAELIAYGGNFNIELGDN